MHVAADDDAFIGPRVGRAGRTRAHAAAHFDALAGDQVAAEADLAIGADADAGIAVEQPRAAAQGQAAAVEVVEHLAAGHHLSVDFRVLRRDHDDAAVGVGGGDARATRHLDADAVAVGAALQADQVVGAEGAADLDEIAVLGLGHATQPELTGGLDVDGGLLARPGDGLGQQHVLVGATEGLGDHTTGQRHAVVGDIARGVDLDQTAGTGGGDTGRGQAGGAANDDAVALVIGTGRGRGGQRHRLGCGQRGVDQDLLTGGHGDGGIGAQPGDAGRTDGAAGDDAAVNLHVLAAGQHDVRTGAGGIERGGAVYVQADTIGIGAAVGLAQRIGAVQLDATQQRDVAADLGAAFPIGPFVGLDHQVGIRAQQVDVAAHDGIVLAGDDEMRVVLQRGDGAAGQQEAETALTEQHVRIQDVDLVDVAGAVGDVVIGVDHVVAGAVVDHPARGRHHTGRAPVHVGVAVIHALGERRDHALVRVGVRGVDVGGLGVAHEAGLVEHAELLLGGQRLKWQVARVHGADRADRGGDHRLAARVAVVDADLVAHRGGAVLAAGIDGVDQSGDQMRRGGVAGPRGVADVVAVDGDDVALTGHRQRDHVDGVTQQRRRHRAPDDGGVAIVLALTLFETQAVLLLGQCVGVEVHHAIPAAVAEMRQHLVLLRIGESAERGAVGRCADVAPGDVLVLVVTTAALGEIDTDLLAGLGRRVVEHLAIHLGIAQMRHHHRALRGAQLLEAGIVGRRRRSAPVDAAEIEIGRLTDRECGHQTQRAGGIRVVPDAVLVNGIAQGGRHQLLLRRAQAGERGIRRWRADITPMDVGVAVVGDRPLGEAGDQLAAGLGVVVEEILGQLGIVAVQVGDHHRLLVGGEVGPFRLDGGTHELHDHGLLIRGQVGERGARRRRQLEAGAHHGLLRLVQVGVGRAGIRAQRVGHHGLLRRAQVLERRARIGHAVVGRIGVAVDQRFLARRQVGVGGAGRRPVEVGHGLLLRRGEIGERGGGIRHARTAPTPVHVGKLVQRAEIVERQARVDAVVVQRPGMGRDSGVIERHVMVGQDCLLLGGQGAVRRTVGRLGELHCMGIDHRLLAVAQAGVGRTLPRAVEIGHLGLLRIGQIGERGVGGRRRDLAPGRRVQVGELVQRAPGAGRNGGIDVVVVEPSAGRHLAVILGDAAPSQIGDGGVVDARTLRPLAVRDLRIALRTGEASGPSGGGDTVVIEQVPDAVGGHHLLRRAELFERGIGRRRRHAGSGPVHQRIAVVGRHALHEPGQQRARAGVRVVEHHAGVPGIAGAVAQRRSLRQTGAEGVGGGVVETAIGVNGVAQALGHQGLGFVAERGERVVVGDGTDAGVGQQTQSGIDEQRAQVGTDVAGIQRRDDGGDGSGVGGGRQLAARQRVEIVGEAVAAGAGQDGHLPGGGDRAGDLQFAAGLDGQRRVVAGLDRREAVIGEARAGNDGAAAVQVDVVLGAQHDAGAVVARTDGAAGQDDHAGAGIHQHRRIRAAREDTGGADDGVRGDHVHHAAGVQALDAAAAVGGQAVLVGAVGDERVRRDRVVGAEHVDVHPVITQDPAAVEQLLFQQDVGVPRVQAGIGRAQRILDVLALHFHQARIQVQTVG